MRQYDSGTDPDENSDRVGQLPGSRRGRTSPVSACTLTYPNKIPSVSDRESLESSFKKFFRASKSVTKTKKSSEEAGRLHGLIP